MNSLAVTALWSFQIISSLAICNLQILYSRNYVGVWACICVLYLCLWHYTDRQTERQTHTHSDRGNNELDKCSSYFRLHCLVFALWFAQLYVFACWQQLANAHTDTPTHTHTLTHRRHTPALNKRANGGGGNDAWKLTQIVSRLV